MEGKGGDGEERAVEPPPPAKWLVMGLLMYSGIQVFVQPAGPTRFHQVVLLQATFPHALVLVDVDIEMPQNDCDVQVWLPSDSHCLRSTLLDVMTYSSASARDIGNQVHFWHTCRCDVVDIPVYLEKVRCSCVADDGASHACTDFFQHNSIRLYTFSCFSFRFPFTELGYAVTRCISSKTPCILSIIEVK